MSWEPIATAPVNKLIVLRRKGLLYFGTFKDRIGDKSYFTTLGSSNTQPKVCDWWQNIPDSIMENPYKEIPSNREIKPNWKKLWITTPRTWLLNPDTHELIILKVNTREGLRLVDGIAAIDDDPQKCRIVMPTDSGVETIIVDLDFQCVAVIPQIHLNDRRVALLACYFSKTV